MRDRIRELFYFKIKNKIIVIEIGRFFFIVFDIGLDIRKFFLGCKDNLIFRYI